MNEKDIENLLNEYLKRYNREEFIKFDPVQIPHQFTKKEDIEISAFLTSTIAWGQRKSIINNSSRLMRLMENEPYNFIINKVPSYKNMEVESLFELSKSVEWQNFRSFCHRTFNSEDCLFFLLSLKRIYLELGGLENLFTLGFMEDNTIYSSIKYFREKFLELPHQHRVEKHLPNVLKNSAAKRINMFLRWMVRDDEKNIDFGIWKNISQSALMLPLDVHSANISRQIGILSGNKNNWQAVEEATNNLKVFDAKDPIKYDFALFGYGVFNGENIT